MYLYKSLLKRDIDDGLRKRLIEFFEEVLMDCLSVEHLIFSYIGARVCHSEKDIFLLIEEFFEGNKIPFLLNLINLGHTSVFAHAPIIIDLEKVIWRDAFHFFKVSPELILSVFYKSFYYDRKLYLTLRHFVEILPYDTIQNFFVDTFDNFINDKKKVMETRKRFLNNMSEVDCYKVFIPNFFSIEYDKEIDRFELRRIWEIYITIFNFFDNNWLTIYFSNVSKIFTHQFVRHTLLNFCQLSNRKKLPKCFFAPKNGLLSVSILEDIIEYLNKLYHLKKEIKINIEDFRFFIPSGSCTNIIASAPLVHWKDFVKKRVVKEAQDEIRNIANTIDAYFKMIGV